MCCRPNEERISRKDIKKLCQILRIGQLWWVLRNGSWSWQNGAHWWFWLVSVDQWEQGSHLSGLKKECKEVIGQLFLRPSKLSGSGKVELIHFCFLILFLDDSDHSIFACWLIGSSGLECTDDLRVKF